MFQGTYSPEYYRLLHRVVHGRFRTQRGMDTLVELVTHPLRMNRSRVRTIATGVIGAATAVVGEQRLRQMEK